MTNGKKVGMVQAGAFVPGRETVPGQSGELAEKLCRIRGLMREKGLKGIYVKRQENFGWLSCGHVSHLGPGAMGNCGLLVTEDGQYAITNNIEAPRMAEEELLPELGFELLSGVWHQEDFERTAIRELCGEGCVGSDFTAAYGPLLEGEIQKLRFSLTEEEIRRYITGGELVSRLVEEVGMTMRAGETELEVAGRLCDLARRADVEPLSVFCTSDERIYKFRHAIPTEKRIRERAQFGGNYRYKGLVLCCTRYVNFVPLTEELRKQYLDNVEIECTMILHSCPGNTYRDALTAGQQAYAARGWGDEFDKHHQGGPIGYMGRDYRVGFSHDGIIPENQAFCWNPSITGTKSEDTVLVSSGGPLFLTKPFVYPTVTVEVEGQQFVRPGILVKCF